MTVRFGEVDNDVSWYATATVDGIELVMSDDGIPFVPACIIARYTAHPRAHRTPGTASSWSCAEVVFHRRDGRLTTVRTFGPSFKDLPGWAEQFVLDNHPYRKRFR